MGFRGLVPADKLGAVYDPAQQVLTLTACGEVQNYTYGFDFVRLPFTGGLLFELMGWSGPIGTGTSEYSHSQRFDIPGLAIADPSKTVIIITANHTKGTKVEIKFLGLKPSGTSNGNEVLSNIQDKLSGVNEKPVLPEIVDVATPATINTLFKEPFNISEKISAAPGATLHADFDSQILNLTEAGIDDGSLNWTFNSVQTGQTQVITYSTAGLNTPVIRKVYSVKIFVLDAATAAGPDASKAALLANTSRNGNGGISNGASNGISNGNKVSDSVDQILSFLGRVFIAQRIARSVLPSARLLRVQATKPAGPVFPVKDPLLLSQLDVLFVGDHNQYVTLHSTGWGEYAPPVVKLGPVITGLQTFDLEQVKVDIVAAVKAIRASGNDIAFWECTLAEPFGNPNDGPYQPMYTFRMVDTSFVSVNAETGKVVGK
ncbi:hypothetical protein N0V93_007074 [Gnomoniopsis smithogilvyi]|uniref:Uncharacterized protein n=1 Tax=Gnomoniopsis smithogilvyi TaxID=1191159 RepID=A0A9W8YPE4_9PEZI|nr:hypothetical protein N0V93_007074 [Gnomoniopsis smithogilvyi]